MDQIKLQGSFATYAEFEYHFDRWCQENDHLFVTADSKSVAWGNNRLAPGEKPYQEELKYKYKSLKCKHGPSRKTQSTGIRTHQRTLKLECPVQININAEQGNPQCLRITKFNVEHKNHPKDSVRLCPERRRLTREEASEVNLMLAEGHGRPMAVRDYLHAKTGKVVLTKDIQNFKQKIIKSKKGGRTDTEDVLFELEKLHQEDVGSKFSIGYISKRTPRTNSNEQAEEDEEQDDDANAEKEIAYIYFQTSSMSKILNRYPEVLQMDVTYKVNKNDMHLANIQCIDNHGRGRLVGHALIHRETTEILTAVVQQFQRNNPEAASRVETVFVDKDRKEIQAIRQILPQADVHLCYVHVIRVFKRIVKKLNASKNNDQVNKILKDLALSASKEEFVKLYDDLTAICSEPFLKYFDENWKNIPDKWVAYTRQDSTTFGIRSTNHIESQHGKIKNLTKRTDSIAQNVRSLLLLHRNCERESGYKDFRETCSTPYVANCDDPEVQLILNTFVYNTAKLLLKELRESKGLESTSNESDNECDCTFFNSQKLNHCRHLFFLRRQQGLPIVCVDGLRSRFLRPSSEEGEEKPSSQTQGSVQTIDMTPSRRPAPKTGNERYKAAKEVCDKLVALISATGGNQFSSRMENVSALLRIYLSGKEATVAVQENVTGPDDTSESQDHGATGQLSVPEEREHNLCRVCKESFWRLIAESDRNGNKGRYYLQCPNKCTSFFRWHKCEICHSSNVRVGHNCNQNQQDDNDEIDNIAHGNGSPALNSPNVTSERSDSSQHNGEDADLDDINRDIVSISLDGIDIIADGSPTLKTPRVTSESSNSSQHNGEDADDADLDNNNCLDISLNSDDNSNCSTDYSFPSLQNPFSPPGSPPPSSPPPGSDEIHPDSRDSSDKQGESLTDIPPKNMTDEDTSQIQGGQDVQPTSGERLTDLSSLNTAASQVGGGQDVPTSATGLWNQEISDLDLVNMTADEMFSLIETPRIAPTIPKKPKDVIRFLKAKQIDNSAICQVDDGVWKVTSQSNSKLFYKVRNKRTECVQERCQGEAPPCMHLYTCDCPDRSNPCKHIYKVYAMSVSADHTSDIIDNRNDDDQVSGPLQEGNYSMVKKSLHLPAAQKVLGRPNISKTRSFKNVTVQKKPKETNATHVSDKIQDLNPNDKIEGPLVITCVASGKWRVTCNGGITAYVTQKKLTCNQCTEQACSHRYVCSCTSQEVCAHIMVVHATHFPHEVTVERHAWLVEHRFLPHSHALDLVQYSNPGNCQEPTKRKGVPVQRACSICYLESPQPGHTCCPKCKAKHIRRGHKCQCVVCEKAISYAQVSTCYRCLRPVHSYSCSRIEAMPEKDNQCLSICQNCRVTRDTGLNAAALRDLKNNRELTEEHLHLANRFIRTKFPDIAGLAPPVNIQRGGQQIMMTYDIYQPGDTYMQFIGTGSHWLLVIIHEDLVYLLDSMYRDVLVPEVEVQISNIMNTSERRIEVNVPPIQQQDNSVDCALHCIANAMQFAMSRKIVNVTFHNNQLRQHWLSCIESGEISEFPSVCHSDLSGTQMPYKDIEVYCVCRLPDHYGSNMIKCSAGSCHEWFHTGCLGVIGQEKGKWLCPFCFD